MDYSGRVWLNGTDFAIDGAVDKTLIAAQGAGKVIRVLKGYVSVIVAGVGGGARVALEDGVGGTIIWQVNADAVGNYRIDFEPMGYPLTANTLLNLTVDGALTTQASARASVLAII